MTGFDDGKEEGALRTIGEVSLALDIKQHVLRYWEQQFSLLKPLKRSGGRRYYRPEDVAMVEAINRLVNEEGYTLKGAEAVLRSGGGSGADRREGDRRVGDRRSGADDGQTKTQLQSIDNNESMAEYINKLRDIRGRLARAIEA